MFFLDEVERKGIQSAIGPEARVREVGRQFPCSLLFEIISELNVIFALRREGIRSEVDRSREGGDNQIYQF